MALGTHDDQLVMLCFGEDTPPAQCVFFKSGPNGSTYHRITTNTTVDWAMSFKAQIADLRRLLFVTTEVLSVAVLLLFILVLVLVWRINSVVRKSGWSRREVTTLRGQTYPNPAFLSDYQPPPNTKTPNTQHGSNQQQNNEKPPGYYSLYESYA